MKWVRMLNTAALAVASFAILLMTLVGGSDVLSSIVFGRPIPGAYESTEALMVVIVFLAIGWLQTENGNIAIDIFPRRLGPRGRKVHAAACELLALAFFGLLAWQGWLLAVESLRINEQSAGLVRFPLWPSKFTLATGATLAVLCCIARLANLDEAPHKPDPVEEMLQ
jgi:TRAP-type C4-dicarboxylate transport system permease small subunit